MLSISCSPQNVAVSDISQVLPWEKASCLNCTCCQLKTSEEKKDNSRAKAMTREYLDVLLTKAGINIQVKETIACLKTSRFNFQTTLLRWGLGMHIFISATATHSCLFQGYDRSFHQLRIWPQYHSDATWVPHPLGFEEMWSGNLYIRVGFIAKGLSTGFKVNMYQNMRLG